MSDLISRQAAIDAFAEYERDSTAPIDYKKVLMQLLSAQPDVVRCRDCKWFNDIGCAIRIVDDTDKPSEDDFCSFAERRENV